MLHIYSTPIKCQGCHTTSFQWIVFTVNISSHCYQRALSPTAPLHSPTVKTMPTLVSLAERLWTDEVLGLPRSSWCHVYVLHMSTMWNKQVYEQLLGHSGRLALKDALHSAVPTIWCVFCVGKQVRSFPLATQFPERCVWFLWLRGTLGIWLCAK